jgi:hypothetical protein
MIPSVLTGKYYILEWQLTDRTRSRMAYRLPFTDDDATADNPP